jgi:hypothetical protein
MDVFKVVLDNQFDFLAYISFIPRESHMLQNIKGKISRGLAYRKDLPYAFRALVYAIFFSKKTFRLGANNTALKKLYDDGMVLFPGQILPSATVANLKNELESMHCYTKLDANNKPLKKVYEHKDLIASPAFMSLALRDDVLQLAEDYFHCQPKIAYVAAWTVYADSEKDVGEMIFHMDHHGHKFLKLFYYLSDVEVGGGHHEFVQGSHEGPRHRKDLVEMKTLDPDLYKDLMIKKRLKGQFKLDNSMIVRFFKNRVLKVSGAKGMSFIEDTYGLHRGTPIKNDIPRTIFQVLYVPEVLEKDQMEKVDVDPHFVSLFRSGKFAPKYYTSVIDNIISENKTVR